MTTLSINVSDELAEQLKPYATYLDDLLRAGLREARLAQSLGLYQHGNISVWKAARLANVSLREMLLYLSMHGIQADMTPEEIEAELA